MEYPKTAEVIVIGAGVIGLSIAYHLAELGCRNVVVLEKEDAIGAGSTAKAMGGVRQEFCNEVNIRFSTESVEAFKRFEEEIGYPIGFRQCGYLRLVSTEEELEWCRNTAALQKQLGVDVHIITPEEAKQIIPVLNIDNLSGGTYCPTDGKLDPSSVVQGYSFAARERGVKIQRETEVTDILIKHNHVCGVMTTNGPVESPVVVNASGAQAGLVGRMTDADIPIIPIKKHTFYTGPTDIVSKDVPYLIDMHLGFGLHREGRVLHFSGNDPDQKPGFSITVDWDFLLRLAERVIPRLPFMAEIGIMRAEAGLHPDTPDKSPILGDVPEFSGLYLACGMNSQGVMHAPAIGRIMAECILDIHQDKAIETLSLGRFRTGKLQIEGLLAY